MMKRRAQPGKKSGWIIRPLASPSIAMKNLTARLKNYHIDIDHRCGTACIVDEIVFFWPAFARLV